MQKDIAQLESELAERASALAQAEAELRSLREREQRMDLALRGTELGLWDWNVSTGEVIFNDRWAEMLGYRWAELTPSITMWETLVHPEDLAGTQQRLQAHLEGRTPAYEAEYRLRTKDGAWIWVLDRGKVVERDGEGQALRAVGTHLDITDRKRSEQSLEAMRRRLADIIEFLPDATFVIDEEGRVVAWNRALEEMTGVKKEDILGQGNLSYSVAFYGERRPILVDLIGNPQQHVAKLYNYVEGKDAVLYGEAYVPRLFGGRGAHVWIAASPLFDENGTRVGAIESVRDISDFKQSELERQDMEQQLHQAQKMEAVGQLAAGVAHDFNNLLTAILGNVDLARTLAGANGEIAAVLDTVAAAARQATGVTRSLLTFSRKLPTDKHPTDLSDVVDESVRFLRRTLPASMELIAEKESSDELIVDADATQLQQVILNLAINARDAMPEGGRLTLFLGPVGTPPPELADRPEQAGAGWVRLVIGDTGVGMSEEVRTRIFDPFFTTKTRGKGTGLGLSIVHGIVDVHGGTIRVESEEGRGTRFEIYLPRIPAEATSGPAAAESEVPRGQGELVLLADDDRFVRETTVMMLETLGYVVEQVEDGASLVAQAERRQEAVDLLIVDVDLPRGNGLDCLRALRERGVRAPAIVITGSATEGILLEDIADSRVLRKPFQLRRLAKVVRETLRRAGFETPGEVRP